MPNRLIHETSPYLLQHADNPVDWHPWGEEALQRARAEDKPILLSIGYSACHWCHVMAHESFEDPATARLMNELFVNVKVDREERPDLDGIYMEAVQAMTGHGGWPLTVFLTPDGRPFYGGTYFPPTPRHGMPAFADVLKAVADAYRNRKAEVLRAADQLADQLQQTGMAAFGPGPMPTEEALDRAFRRLQSQFDARHGGFGGAPKFPQPMAVELLLRTWKRTGEATALAMAEKTLQEMAKGGIYDQVGGGFHRYAVDAQWLIPHFEKMLYDNAQLACVYLDAFQATGNPLYARIARETIDYVRRDLMSPAGGCYASQDADSEGVEGKYYVWTRQEIVDVLGPEDGPIACRYFGVTEHGNFEGHTVLHVTADVAELAAELEIPAERLEEIIARSRRQLFAARARRVQPGRDEKVLTGWNGLMLRAIARGGRVLGENGYLDLAAHNARFVLDHLTRDGQLLRTYRDGQAKIPGYLEDYAFLADGLLTLYEASLDVGWFEQARALADTMVAEFWDAERGGFFDTARGAEQLIARPKSFLDSALPSGNSVAADLLLRLAVLTGDESYRRKAETVFGLLREVLPREPTMFGRILSALDFALAPPTEIAIVGEAAAPTEAMLAVVYRGYLPNKVVAGRSPADVERARPIVLLTDRPQVDGLTTAYVCEQYACLPPVTEPAALAEQLHIDLPIPGPGA